MLLSENDHAASGPRRIGTGTGLVRQLVHPLHELRKLAILDAAATYAPRMDAAAEHEGDPDVVDIELGLGPGNE